MLQSAARFGLHRGNEIADVDVAVELRLLPACQLPLPCQLRQLVHACGVPIVEANGEQVLGCAAGQLPLAHLNEPGEDGRFGIRGRGLGAHCLPASILPWSTGLVTTTTVGIGRAGRLVGQGKSSYVPLSTSSLAIPLMDSFLCGSRRFLNSRTSFKHTLQARNHRLGSHCSDLTGHAAGIEMLKPRLVRALGK